jgi:uncharacterized protein (DUF1800 family)
VSLEEAARFLVQASFGPTMADVQRVSSIGIPAWIDEQFAMRRGGTHWAFMLQSEGAGCITCTKDSLFTGVESFWTLAVRGQDQLRQRISFALSEIFVISAIVDELSAAEATCAYMDLLADNAFGNFRTLLEAVTRSPTMGWYLSHLANEKEDPSTGRIPDQNFAREVMQLFSIGLWELNSDGSRRLDGAGQPIPTYGQAEIAGMSRVFTGLSWNQNWWGPWDYNLPMQHYSEYVSSSEKRIVGGVVIPANTSGPESVRIALDTLFNHANTGPFIGEQLIKRLVTSNPSRAYVGRVAAAFANDGGGVRGDMKAVVRAVLMDPEARDPAKTLDPTWGKLREPILRMSAWLRAFNAQNSKGRLSIWGYLDPLENVGQLALQPPSVFNWFRPDYSPPGAIRGQGLVAPEFQITHESSTTSYANFVVALARDGYDVTFDNPENPAVVPDYSAELALASQPDALLDRLNLVLMGGQLSSGARAIIRTAIEAIPTSATNASLRRVQTAVALCMASPDFVVQK